MDISGWRKKIDEVDEQLVALLNERARYVLEIGAVKKEMKMPVYEPAREIQIMENIRRWNSGPLADEALQRVFERIIDEGRSIQRGPMQAPRQDE
jgi:chorismate mutase-like protein